jgi:hypothetical protein
MRAGRRARTSCAAAGGSESVGLRDDGKRKQLVIIEVSSDAWSIDGIGSLHVSKLQQVVVDLNRDSTALPPMAQV